MPVIDLDQGRLWLWQKEGWARYLDALLNDVQLADVIAPTLPEATRVYRPTTIQLAGAEIELVSVMSRERSEGDTYWNTRRI